MLLLLLLLLPELPWPTGEDVEEDEECAAVSMSRRRERMMRGKVSLDATNVAILN